MQYSVKVSDTHNNLLNAFELYDRANFQSVCVMFIGCKVAKWFFLLRAGFSLGNRSPPMPCLASLITARLQSLTCLCVTYGLTTPFLLSLVACFLSTLVASSSYTSRFITFSSHATHSSTCVIRLYVILFLVHT